MNAVHYGGEISERHEYGGGAQSGHYLRYRHHIADEDKDDIIKVGDLTLDLKKIEARVKGEVINLTKKEFDVLKYLASQPGQVVTREMLLREVWEYEEYVGAIRTIDVTMNRIRDKIEKDKANPKILITKRGVGYYVTDKN